MSTNQPIAVAARDVKEFGCPYCGYRSGRTVISRGGTAIVSCGECDRMFAMLAEGVTRSSIGFGNFYPELGDHPRRGTPRHGRPDKKPEGGGEFFSSRGIGSDGIACFLCGEKPGMFPMFQPNIAAFVQCKEAGERVVSMFQQGAVLDYRESEPDRVQVKIGACQRHLPNLEWLDARTSIDHTITADMIKKATKYVAK